MDSRFLNIVAPLVAALLFSSASFAQECEECCGDGCGPETAESKVKYVALSFDDGPSQKYTPLMLDILEENGVRASFFLIGRNINEDTAPIIRRMVSLGCDVENHTYSHPRLTEIPDSLILEEVARTDSLIEHYAGVRPEYLRPPFTAHNAHVAQVIDGKIFIAGLSCRDWRADMPVEDRVTMTLDRVQDGLILLFHDTNERTVEAMKTIIPQLKERGYRIVSISELFAVSGRKPEYNSPEMYGRAY